MNEDIGELKKRILSYLDRHIHDQPLKENETSAKQAIINNTINSIDEAKKDFPYPDIKIDIIDNKDYAKGFQDAHNKWCRKFEKWFGDSK